MNILFPIFALVALTLGVMLRLAYLRYTAVVSRKVDPEYYTAYQGEEPAYLAVTSRHLINLMETPVLFYLACIVAFISNHTGSTVVLLAWSYVALRLAHSFIHLGSNNVLWRFRCFILSVAVMASMWVILFLGLISR